MTALATGADALTDRHTGALAQRLRAVAEVLLDDAPPVDDDPARDAALLLGHLAGRVARDPDPGRTWLLLVGASGALPTTEEVQALRRALDLAPEPADAELELLDHSAPLAARAQHPVRLELLVDAVVLDVTFSATNDKQTGIQRVARRVSRSWVGARGAVLAAWADDDAGLRRLDERETHRVLRHDEPWTGPTPATAPPTLLVPWRSTVLLTEVPPVSASSVLAALAQFSGNEVVAIGYDAIPVTLADLRPLPDAGVFVRYLTVLKHARRIAGISESAAAEFRGFSQALVAQGLAGPDVVEVALATQVETAGETPGTASAVVPAGVPGAEPPAGPGADPVVLCMGSHELHKNHLAVLHAAELLWREGLRFALHFVGGEGWDMRGYDEAVSRAREAGRPVVDHGRLPDAAMWRVCRSAAFTVFPSLHEGFGLPVAESLACGTPVVTTDYGSTAEIAAGGGCLLVDPRDDASLRAGMRRLLTDADLLARLRDEARSVPLRTWDAYTDDLWDALVRPSGADRP